MGTREEALLINGVYEDVLQEILTIQSHIPEQVLFLQPYSSRRIKSLAENPPSVDERVRLFLSVTTELSTVTYVGEIVGWHNKLELSPEKSAVIQRSIWTLQPNEGGVYNIHPDEKRQSVNLLHVWRIRRLSNPFPVDQLRMTNGNEPLSPNRTTSGGWLYVSNPCEDWLATYL